MGSDIFIENMIDKFVIINDLHIILSIFHKENNSWEYFQLKDWNELSNTLRSQSSIAKVCKKCYSADKLLSDLKKNDKNTQLVFSTPDCWFNYVIGLNAYSEDEIMTILQLSDSSYTKEYIEEYKKHNFEKYQKEVCDIIFDYFVEDDKEKIKQELKFKKGVTSYVKNK